MPMCSRKATIITSIACACVILILGITALVLGVKGYFTFHDPCIELQTFEIVDLDLDTAEDNTILSFVDAFTGGLASELVPTQATLTIDMIFEVNNTNPYDLGVEQADEGVIEIPADEEGSVVDEDLVVGTWEVPDATLKANSRTEIPVEVKTTIDLLSLDAAGLAGSFLTGQLVVFRISGGIQGTSWVPGASGKATIVCIANVDNILELGTLGKVKCKHSTKVGRYISRSGEVDVDAFEDDDEVDPQCIV